MKKLALALVAAGVLLAAGRPASAGAGMVSGGGTKDGVWTFGGAVRIGSAGSAAGRFVVSLERPGYKPTVCVYTSFGNASVSGHVGAFDAKGICSGENESGPFTFVASNRFGIVDNAAPGSGRDSIDVNFYGPSGIAIPGGTIAAGDLRVDS